MTYSFYDASTGLFTSRTFAGSAQALALNTPRGTRAIEGTFDRLTQRVDLATGEVVKRERPAEEVEAEQKAKLAEESRRVIGELEAKQQRVVREALLALLPAGPEKLRLEEIDAEIAAKREALSTDEEAAPVDPVSRV